MGTRREFLQLTVAAAALSATGAASAAAGRQARMRETPSLDLYKIIYDERFPVATQFARQVNEAGHAIHAITGDVTAVWFHDLSVRWKQGAAAIAGVTAPSALFCLERLAWDHGMRCVHHAEHRADDLAVAAQVAQLVTRFPLSQAVPTRAPFAALPALSNDQSNALVSWVIAPVNRR